MSVISKFGFAATIGLTLVAFNTSAADLSEAAQKERKRIASTVPLADLHMHDAFGMHLAEETGVAWGGLGSKRGSRFTWLAIKERQGDKFIAWAGQAEFNQVFFRGGIEAMLDPNNPRLVKLYEQSEKDLKEGKIVGIGEIFINNQRSNKNRRMRRKGQVDAPGIRKFYNLVSKYNGFMAFHMEADRDSMRELGRLLASNRKGRVLLNHCGSTSSASQIRSLMNAHPNVFCELSFRYPPVNSNSSREIFNSSGIQSSWRQLMENHSDRFLVGTDAHDSGEFTGAIETVRQGLLPNLSMGTARKIAFQNAERLFGLKVDPEYLKRERERSEKIILD
ncbi:MAG TPA: hypothetical protein EYQ26_10845 [Rhodospirillales bacterium]|jgi:predicted TIM-barrel fold metal-dependent hydrolase|nr:hypothetical protein [Rhodospirillales bacterium]